MARWDLWMDGQEDGWDGRTSVMGFLARIQKFGGWKIAD
jgi:hypothetical protein